MAPLKMGRAHVLPIAVLVLVAVSGRAAPPSEEVLLTIAGDARAGRVERTRAFADLRAVATDRSIPALARWLADPTWSFAARSVLEVMPGAAVDRALLQALAAAETEPLQVGLVNSLGRRRCGEAVTPMAGFLTSPGGALVEATLRALGDIGTEAAADALASFRPSAASHAAWADATLRAAEALQAANGGKAAELYRLVREKGPPAQGAAATVALARSASSPNEAILAALKSSDSAARLAVLAAIRSGEFGSGVIEAIGIALPELRPEVQVQVLSVLYDRRDAAAAPLARSALASPEPNVQAAAASLLGIVGGPADAPALRRMMTGADEPARSARFALARIRGEETTKLLLDAFRGGNESRLAALEVLVSRGYRPLLAELLDPGLYHDDALRPVLASAVLSLGTANDLERVLSLYRALPPGERAALEGALRRLAAKHPSVDDAAAVVSASAEKLPVEESGPLLSILAGVGGDRALALLTEMLASPAVELRRAALRALGQWRDERAADALLRVARSDPDGTVRAIAVRSAAAVFGRSALGANNAPNAAAVPGAIAGLTKTWELAELADGRNAVLVALRGIKDPRALEVARELEQRSSSPAVQSPP